ncbi:hypothetical protein [Nocardioides sp.]|uniref:hypothetical protein n=1 Tax=Nocardioides sp. TaxID=35761 RepID=UPI0035627C1C
MEIDTGSPLGEVYLDSLLAAQLRAAGWLLMLLVIGVGSLPILFFVVPDLVEVTLLGAPLPWLVLGVAVYPFLLALGWGFIRRVEGNERAFVDLMGRDGSRSR